MKALILKRKLKKIANPETAMVSRRFFKTGANQYGAGDIFIGIKTGPLRSLAKENSATPLTELTQLLESRIHEERALALMVLNLQFTQAMKSKETKLARQIFNYYIRNRKHINNWDLVDGSAPTIVGGYLSTVKDREILYKLAVSDNLWDRRIAIVSTLHFIRFDDFSDTLSIAKALRDDSHDLIHKAVGWMLRELGKRDKSVLVQFLNEHSSKMPRTMLRYAIERFEPEERQFYLKNKINSQKTSSSTSRKKVTRSKS